MAAEPAKGFVLLVFPSVFFPFLIGVGRFCATKQLIPSRRSMDTCQSEGLGGRLNAADLCRLVRLLRLASMFHVAVTSLAEESDGRRLAYKGPQLLKYGGLFRRRTLGLET